MALSAPGVGSNLDVNSIVNQLMTIERRPLTLLNTKEASFQAQLSAYGGLQSALSSFQSAVAQLSGVSAFQALSANSSDAAVVAASAGTQATAGSYLLDITQLAQGHSVAAAGRASATNAIGSGASTTITFDFGTISGGTLANGVYSGASFSQNGAAASGTVTIDASNNSLAGIRDAINAARLGVTASIVRDGSAAPYRLVVQSAETGVARSLRISVTGDASLTTLLAYDPAGTQNLTQTQAAQDALFSTNGIAVSSASNSITDVIEGVTLTLAKAGSAKVTVAANAAGAKTAIEGFVKAYNDLNKTLADLTRFDPAGQNSGLLIGDATVRSIQTQVRRVLTESLSGITAGSVSLLSQIGISFQRDGSLALNSTRLSDALVADPDAVAALFASVGRPTDSLVRFVSGTAETGPGRYAVDVTQIATRGKLVGAVPAGLTITAGVNDQLTVTVDGISATVTLAAGTYTASSLAAQLQAVINGASTLSGEGVGVLVTETGGVLTLTSTRYGSASSVTASGSAAQGLLGAAPVSTDGVDVAGTINGSTASGSGQILTGVAGDAEGLAVEVSGGTTGARGSIDFSRGYAWRLDSFLTELLSTTGALRNRTDGINRSIEEIGRQRETLDRRMEGIEERYRAQFAALDTLVARMNTTSNFLTQQLAQLPVSGQQSA